MRNVDISPNQRYALVGKTRSGKTTLGMALACMLVPFYAKDADGWEAWWIDTKGDTRDLASLNEWGFYEKPKKTSRRLFTVRNDPRDAKKRQLAWEKAQDIFDAAYEQQGVLVIVDEYVQVVRSQINAGEPLLNIFQRGGGLDVGLIGMTQEPVYVPRQLISQASHQFLFNVSFPNDIRHLKRMFLEYEPPLYKGMDHSHGFFHVAVDFDGKGKYYKNQYDWAKDTGLLENLAA